MRLTRLVFAVSTALLFPLSTSLIAAEQKPATPKATPAAAAKPATTPAAHTGGKAVAPASTVKPTAAKPPTSSAPKATTAPAPKATTARASKAAASSAPKAPTAAAPKTGTGVVAGPGMKASTKTAAAKTTAVASTSAPTTTAANSAKTAKKTPASAPAPAAATTTSTRTTTATPSTWTPNNPVAEKLSTKSNLLAKVKTSLPANTDLNAATSGFKNFGQFIAAVNVSKNLNIPFEDLKASMTGTNLKGEKTGTRPTSLGNAIRLLRGDVDPTSEAQKATAEAEAEINGK